MFNGVEESVEASFEVSDDDSMGFACGSGLASLMWARAQRKPQYVSNPSLGMNGRSQYGHSLPIFIFHGF